MPTKSLDPQRAANGCAHGDWLSPQDDGVVLVSSQRKLMQDCIKVLQLIEGTRHMAQDLGTLARAILRLIQHVLDRAALPPVQQTCTQCGKMHTPSPARSLRELAKFVTRTHETLASLQARHPNYFGVWRPRLYINEALWLQHELTLQLDRTDPPTTPTTHQPLTCMPPNPAIRGWLSQLWWQRRGWGQAPVPWSEFRKEFTAVFGDQPRTAMEEMRRLLCSQQPAGANTGINQGDSAARPQSRSRANAAEPGPQEEVVTPEQFNAFVHPHTGVYEAFQARVDPGRAVYIMGVVDDEPSGLVALPIVVEGLLGLHVTQVCCGGQHAAVLTREGEVWTWGRGGFGRLGHGNGQTVAEPRRVEALVGTPCVQVACGFAYTAAVTESRDLYMWGAGENGRLGLGDPDDRNIPCQVVLTSRVQQVYAGSVHTCVLMQEGTVYAFGKHEYTGHGGREDVLSPRIVDFFQDKPVRQVSVGPGGYHTIALTCDGDVYTWGHNRVGQLGYSNTPEVVPRNVEGAYFLPTPQKVSALSGVGVVKVVAGWGHSAALTTQGRLYICGRNYQGQLGLGDPTHFEKNERGHPHQPQFVLVPDLQQHHTFQIALGGEHSVALTNTGDVYSFGAGQKGQLGHGLPEHGPPSSEWHPRLVRALQQTRRPVLQVACGNNCTLVLAGAVKFPTLFERCVALVRATPSLWQNLAELGLPSDMVERIELTAKAIA